MARNRTRYSFRSPKIITGPQALVVTFVPAKYALNH